MEELEHIYPQKLSWMEINSIFIKYIWLDIYLLLIIFLIIYFSFTHKSDMWSLGLCLYELMNFHSPFGEMNEKFNLIW
jgi:serine/threonine protein kinase